MVFSPWHVDSWPECSVFDDNFLNLIERIFQETILDELDNVLNDASAATNGSLFKRGHVIALAQLCAVDALSSFCLKKEKRYSEYIENFFPEEYKTFSSELFFQYRSAMVHSWFLSTCSVVGDDSSIRLVDNHLVYGIFNFQLALRLSVKNLLEKLRNDSSTQRRVLKKYNELRNLQ